MDLNKDNIILWLYQNQSFNDSLVKICKNPNHIDDLKSELILNLFNKSDSQVINLYNSGNMVWWSIRYLKNQYHSNTSPFYKLYRSNLSELTNDYQYNETELDDYLLVEKIEHILDNEIHWFDSHLFKLYYLNTITEDGEVIKPMSLRKIKDLHKIGDLNLPISVIKKSLDKTLKIIKNKLKNEI